MTVSSTDLSEFDHEEVDEEASDGDSELQELCTKVQEDIDARQVWLNRQTTWYVMRHDGLRRREKPWPWASDLHFPLCDSIIEKLKPFYFNQLFGTETIAQFIPKPSAIQQAGQDSQPTAIELGQWFDWKLKQRSNLEIETLISIDQMLMAGFSPMAVRWDPEAKRLVFDAIEPIHLIVPDYTRDIQSADRVTIVREYSPEQYKNDPSFTEKDPDFVKRITGTGNQDSSDPQVLQWTKCIREGITGGERNENIIIVFEIWERVGFDSEDTKDSEKDEAEPDENDGLKWKVQWASPLATDTPLRDSVRYRFCPVVRFDREIKEKGHYASRGIPEKVAPFENSITKHWNEKNDYMSICNRPIFTSSLPIPNAANMTFTPGQFVPGGLETVKFNTPALSFDQEMQSTRAVAENLIGMPDNGLTEQSEGGPNDARTATEIQQIKSLSGVMTDMNARTFRLRLAELLAMAWETLCQYDTDTQFFVANEIKQLPAIPQADDWMIQPNGSSDTWNKPLQMQKAIMRKQLFAKSPWISQPGLDKSILELDDPKLVRELFIDPKIKAQSDYQNEMILIPALMLGAPLQVLPEEDQQPRIKALIDFMEQRAAIGQPIDPLGMHGIMMRLQGHIASLQASDPKAGAQAVQQVQQALKQMPPPQVLPNAGAPGTGAPGASPASPAPERPKPLAESIAWKPADLTPSERAQALREVGIVAAAPAELEQWSQFQAQLEIAKKQASKAPQEGAAA